VTGISPPPQCLIIARRPGFSSPLAGRPFSCPSPGPTPLVYMMAYTLFPPRRVILQYFLPLTTSSRVISQLFVLHFFFLWAFFFKTPFFGLFPQHTRLFFFFSEDPKAGACRSFLQPFPFFPHRYRKRSTLRSNSLDGPPPRRFVFLFDLSRKVVPFLVYGFYSIFLFSLRPLQQLLPSSLAFFPPPPQPLPFFSLFSKEFFKKFLRLWYMSPRPGRQLPPTPRFF